MALSFKRGLPALLVATGLLLLPQISHRSLAQDATGDQSATSKHTGKGTVIRDSATGRILKRHDTAKTNPPRDSATGRILKQRDTATTEPPRDPGTGRIIHKGPDHGQPDTGTVTRVSTPAANAGTNADKAKSPFNSRSDMGSSAQMHLQQMQDQRAKQMETMSNMMKKQSEMPGSAMRNVAHMMLDRPGLVMRRMLSDLISKHDPNAGLIASELVGAVDPELEGAA